MCIGYIVFASVTKMWEGGKIYPPARFWTFPSRPGIRLRRRYSQCLMVTDRALFTSSSIFQKNLFLAASNVKSSAKEGLLEVL